VEVAKKVGQGTPCALFYDVAVGNDDSIEIPFLDRFEKVGEGFAILDRARSLELVGEAESLVALGFGGESIEILERGLSIARDRSGLEREASPIQTSPCR